MNEKNPRSVEIFLASLKSNSTEENYLVCLNKFKKYAEIDNLDEFVKKDPKEIQLVIENYVLHLRKTNHPNSVPTLYYPIQTFLEMNDVMINFKKMRRLFPQTVKSSVERGWTTEEVQKMLKVSDSLRTIALIHFENATGGRIGLLDDLRIEHLTPIVDEKYGKCYAVTGYADCKEQYTTFLTPEATKALDDYLESRKTKERISDNSHVFVSINGEKLSTHSMGSILKYPLKKAGLRNSTHKKGNRFSIPCNHGFRHRFNEIVKSSNVINPHIAERLLSHSSKIIPLDTSYFKPDVDTLFNEYKKLINLLTIDDSERLRVENQSIKVERSEYESMKKRLEELEKYHKITKWTELIST